MLTKIIISCLAVQNDDVVEKEIHVQFRAKKMKELPKC